MSEARSCRDIAKALGGGKPLGHGLGLEFDGLRIDVATNSPELAALLREYYSGFSASGGRADIRVAAVETDVPDLGLDFTPRPPGPGKTLLKNEYADLADGRVVRKARTGMVFVFGGGENHAFGPCLANSAQVVNFINNRHLESMLRRGGLLLHAAGVAVRGRGLALAGFSGAGKSTLALHIMRRGTDFVSNDRLVARRGSGGTRMAGVAKMPRVNPGTVVNNPALWPLMDPADRERYSRLPTAELWDLERKYDAGIDACFGPGRFTLSANLAGLVVLNWKLGSAAPAHAEVSLARRPDLMPAFMKNPGVFLEGHDPADATGCAPERYLKELRGCPVLEFTGGVDFDRATDISLDFLKKHTG